MLLNRLIAPLKEKIHSFELTEANKEKLDNGIEIFFIDAGSQDVVRVDFLFEAGTWVQTKNTQAHAVNSLLLEGTNKRKAREIADEIDFYGSFIQLHVLADYASITLYCLNKHLESSLNIIRDIISDSIFPESEIDVFKNQQIQKLKVSKEKNAYLAYKHFNALLYGENHPYGRLTKEEDYLALNRSDLKEFYDRNYSSHDCRIIFSGKITEKTIKTANKVFGVAHWGPDIPTPSEDRDIVSNGLKLHHLQRPDSVQTAIQIGRTFIKRTDPDYRPMQLLNLTLGGYFGSRLMKNIREEKGLTYGIYSSLESYKHGGKFSVSTEVKNESAQLAVDEIYKEIKMLQTTLITPEELDVVKNYMLGSFLRSIDGPFALADKFILLLESGLNYDYYYDFIRIIHDTNAEKLMELANKYWKREDLFELLVGDKK